MIEDKDDKEIQRMYFESLTSELYVSVNEEIEDDAVAISFGTKKEWVKDRFVDKPIPLGTFGNIMVIQAEAKVGKSFLMSLIATVFLNGNAGTRGGDLRGHRDERGVVHFDTEQSKKDAQKVFKRPFRITGKNHEDYYTFYLRELNYSQRLGYIKYWMEEHGESVGMVFIDGISDLAKETNDEKEAAYVVDELMTLSSKYNCCICTVIHTNPASEKSRGHLGGELLRKAESSIHIGKTINGDYLEVKPVASRGGWKGSFTYTIDKYALPKVITPPELKNF